MHWLMALLIAAVFALIELREIFPKGSVPRETMKSLHFSLGLAVLALVVLRLVVRVSTRTPPIEPRPAAWQTLMAHGAHLALYGLMLAMPILGWLLLSAEGKDVAFFGLSLPPLTITDKAGAELFEEMARGAGNGVLHRDRPAHGGGPRAPLSLPRQHALAHAAVADTCYGLSCGSTAEAEFRFRR